MEESVSSCKVGVEGLYDTLSRPQVVGLGRWFWGNGSEHRMLQNIGCNKNENVLTGQNMASTHAHARLSRTSTAAIP